MEDQQEVARLGSLAACPVPYWDHRNQHSLAGVELEVLLLKVEPGEEIGCSFVAVVLVEADVGEMVVVEAFRSAASHMEQVACATVWEAHCILDILHMLVEAVAWVALPCHLVVQQDSRSLQSCLQASVVLVALH